MKIAAVYCIYNEGEYLEYSVRSLLPAVEKVILCLGTAPYSAYATESIDQFPPDDTGRIVRKLADEFPNQVQVIEGRWADQLAHREMGLKRCLELGMDYHFLVDGDEVYKAEHLRHIRETLSVRPEVGTFIIKCITFWRSFRYAIPAELNSWRPRRLFKITPVRRILGIPFPHRLRFVGANDLNSIGTIHEFPPEEAVYYHFSYARSPARMREKLSTFPHAQEILSGWYERVWKAWPQNRQMENIHPVDPPKFPRAVPWDPADLPEVMRRHPYYGREIIE
ncbi:MAG: hypothetical protein COV76_01480 [Candidatus Omnitrophica bacterium CG11_big_fil_rev_8_21_14_0_20_64_10]|nr:MAG: hypothetical protein COV76_01480 [Candidatus Omnitrophica bacterium CG11_big_fil_rev_8_21_14_0_20_64_10]